jgi:hypothetical protein
VACRARHFVLNQRRMSDPNMPLPHVTKPSTIYRLRGLALFRFAFNWLAFIFIVLGALNSLVFGIPTGLDSIGRIFFCAAVPLLLMLGLWYNWRMVWKIETRDDGLLFSTLFQRRFVSWSTFTDILNKRWGDETIYFVHCRNQGSIRFPSGMDRQDELLSLIRQYVPERFLTVDKESRQDKASLFRQGFILVWSFGAIAGGTIELISMLTKILSGDLSNAIWIAQPVLFLVIGISLGATTISRVKSVQITGRGLLVRTWLSEFEVTWQDIKSVRRFPFGRTMLIASRPGWFIFGEELSRFDDLSQLIHNNTKLINRDDNDKLLPG